VIALGWAAFGASEISVPSDSNVSKSMRGTRDSVLQRLSFKKLHGDEGLSTFFANLVDGTDGGMVER